MSPDCQGYWIPVLHSHLPFVKHPEFDYFLEEHWLFEAVTETYIPLLMNLDRLEREGVDFRLTISVTPPLAEMLADAYLTDRYLKYLDRLIELTGKEFIRLENDEKLLPVARFYAQRLSAIGDFFTGALDSCVLNGYRRFYDSGQLEIITCGATHGFLPILSVTPRAVEAQIKVAVDSHTRHFGRPPRGIWLPECAFYTGLDEVLAAHGIAYFFMDSHGLLEGVPPPKYAVYAPVYTVNSVAVFARDPLSSRQVWSSKAGYPGDFDYRDFYRDLGYDLDFDYIKPYISPDGHRVFTGIKYYAITGPTDEKLPYDPAAAARKTAIHAAHFHRERIAQLDKLAAVMDRPPAVVSPYDAELFGHWWFEGPDFLYRLFCEIDAAKIFKPLTPPEYLALHPENQVIAPCPSSWGDKGFYEVWLNEKNDWIYPHLHHMADAMSALADKHYDDRNPLNNRVLNQMARELLLAQSSDWAFLITMGTAVEYSVKRTKEHVFNFNTLHGGFKAGRIDAGFLDWIEHKNSIFRDIDFRVYSRRPAG